MKLDFRLQARWAVVLHVNIPASTPTSRMIRKVQRWLSHHRRPLINAFLREKGFTLLFLAFEIIIIIIITFISSTYSFCLTWHFLLYSGNKWHFTSTTTTLRICSLYNYIQWNGCCVLYCVDFWQNVVDLDSSFRNNAVLSIIFPPITKYAQNSNPA